jgi:DNA invertase Pin-like site-specific DNA recombinase
MCFIRAYLRASTNEQNAARARDQVKAFATERGMQIAAWYVENESGAKLTRRAGRSPVQAQCGGLGSLEG